MGLLESRRQYTEDRREQKRIIIERVFKPLGLTASMSGGAGKSGYTSGNEMTPFDLSYWLWVDGKKENKAVVTVYLQSFDRDPGSKNYHVLLDRLSVQVNDGEIIRTDIDLPLDEEKISQLKEYVRSNL